MSDHADIERQAREAREFDHVAGGITFRLRVPTRYQTRVATLRAQAAVAAPPSADGANVTAGPDAAITAIIERALVTEAVVGWSALPLNRILPGADPGEQYAYHPAAVALLLDERPEWASSIGLALFDRMVARAQLLDSAEKNSGPGSTGTNPVPTPTTSTT